jgi:hypothetical protein
MERAARVFKNAKYSKSILSEEDQVRAIWPSAVGKAIAAHTLRLRVVRNSLVVDMEDALWQRQLYPLTTQILHRLQRIMGSDAIQSLEFRIGVPRRQPQRSESRDGMLWSNEQPGADGTVTQAGAGPQIDDAERIQDPVLKKVYRLSRKKATA